MSCAVALRQFQQGRFHFADGNGLKSGAQEYRSGLSEASEPCTASESLAGSRRAPSRKRARDSAPDTSSRGN